MVGEFLCINPGLYTQVSLTFNFIVLPLCYDCLPVISAKILYFLCKSASECPFKIFDTMKCILERIFFGKGSIWNRYHLKLSWITSGEIYLLIFISWRLITLQYCSGFCHTLTWISHGFTCVPHPEPPSHLPPHPIPVGHPGTPALSTCLMHPTWAGDLFHTW